MGHIINSVGKHLGYVWYIYLKIKNYYLKICVEIYVGEKIYKNMCNIV